jgi:hypothetical protein
MLLHKLPKKTVRRLRKSVIWTDIAANPATVAAHGLMDGLARRSRRLSPRGTWLRSITALTAAFRATQELRHVNETYPAPMNEAQFDHETALTGLERRS